MDNDTISGILNIEDKTSLSYSYHKVGAGNLVHFTDWIERQTNVSTINKVKTQNPPTTTTIIILVLISGNRNSQPWQQSYINYLTQISSSMSLYICSSANVFGYNVFSLNSSKMQFQLVQPWSEGYFVSPPTTELFSVWWTHRSSSPLRQTGPDLPILFCSSRWSLWLSYLL